jgi:glycerophosphoryl diester phosphodiesterase
MAHRTLICAHRGASAELPDNSIAAFEAAIAAGADMIETDVRRGTSGELVLAHDPVTGDDSPLVRLADLVSLAAGRIMLDLELKEPELEEELLAAVRPYPRGLLVTSFLPDVLARVHELDPTVRTGFLVDEGSDLFERAADCRARLVAPSIAILTPALLQEADRLRSPLAVWTVNDEATLKRLLADGRIGCVITDVPGRARELDRVRPR